MQLFYQTLSFCFALDAEKLLLRNKERKGGRIVTLRFPSFPVAVCLNLWLSNENSSSKIFVRGFVDKASCSTELNFF